jgi:hypothetical protein
MIDLLLVCLRDPYNVIHQSAVRALRFTTIERDEIGWDTLHRILEIEKILRRGHGS